MAAGASNRVFVPIATGKPFVDSNDKAHLSIKVVEIPRFLEVSTQDFFMTDTKRIHIRYTYLGDMQQMIVEVTNNFIEEMHTKSMNLTHFYEEMTKFLVSHFSVQVYSIVEAQNPDLKGYSPLRYTLNAALQTFLRNTFSKEHQSTVTVLPASDNPFSQLQSELGESSIEEAARTLPGVHTRVGYPCGCFKFSATLFVAIIHLNDRHSDWSRERIADWIDELHDNGTINAEFEPWDEEAGTDDEQTGVDTGLDGWKEVGYTLVDEHLELFKEETNE